MTPDRISRVRHAPGGPEEGGDFDGSGQSGGLGGPGGPRDFRAWTGFAAMAGFVPGVAWQLQQPVLWSAPDYAVPAVAAMASLAVLHGVRRRMRRIGRRGVLACLLLGAAVGAGSTGWRAALYGAAALDPALEGRDLQVVGVVAQMPQHNEGGVRFRFDVESARWSPDARNASTPTPTPTPTPPMPRVPERLALGWYAEGTGLWGRGAEESAPAVPARAQDPGPVHAGERWRFTVRLKAPHGNLNPHGVDQELWLWDLGVRASGYVRTGARDAPPERLGATGSHPVERLRESVRDAVFERIADRRLAGVVAALVTGDQAAIERADWDVFRATGVAHLVSISGLHITMFAWLAAAAVGALWRRSARLMLRWPAQQAARVGGVGLAAAYALFSGWGVPSQRTVWMLAAVALLRLGGCRWPWPFVWLLACWVVVAIDPWALMQAGFWLSFVAVAALSATDAMEASARAPGWRARLARMAREQAVVTLALTPLTLLLFQQVSGVGLAANALAIPWVTLVVTPLAMLGAVVPPLWDVAAWAVRALAWWLQWLAGLPFATLSMAAPPLGLAVCGVAGGVIASMRLPWSARLLGLPLVLPVLLWQPPRPAPGEFEVLGADIGQGNAVLVRTATHSLLYDTGPRYSLESDAGHRVLVPLLRAMGERLDTVVLSHRDSDHTGGAAAVLQAQPQARLLASIEAGHPLQALRPAERCVAGRRWTWDGVAFEVLHPLLEDYAGVAVKPNTVSCVLRIGNGRTAALLAGDIERRQEAALAARADAASLRADLLLVPHHGSKTSSSPPLLEAVRPRIALVQAGYRNRFGHPAPAVVEAYAAVGTTVLDSAHCGAARWSSLRPQAVACERTLNARYWHHRVP